MSVKIVQKRVVSKESVFLERLDLGWAFKAGGFII